MSWSRGSSIMSDIISAAKKRNKSTENRYCLYTLLIPIFEEYDCDTLYECEGEDKAFKTALKDMHVKRDQRKGAFGCWRS